MRLKKDLVIRQVADTWIVLALADSEVNFDGILTLNESAVLLWRELEKGANKDAMIDALISEYNVDRKQASEDIDAFLRKLIEAGCISEE